MTEVQKIEKADLYRLESLLRASYGETLDLLDELNYFDKMPHGSWFYLSEDEQPQGFVRSFEIGGELFQVELYVTPSDTWSSHARVLLQHFKDHNKLSNSAKVRFEIEEGQTDTLVLLAQLFSPDQVKRFLDMRKHLQVRETWEDTCTQVEGSFEEIRRVLSVLKNYPVETLKRLHAEKNFMSTAILTDQLLPCVLNQG